MASEVVDEIILVNTDEICAAIKDIFEDMRADRRAGRRARRRRPEALVADAACRAGATLVAINSGANMNFDRLRHVAERAEIGEQREALLAVEIPEQPGSFLASATRSATATSPSSTTATRRGRGAHIFVGVRCGAARRSAEIIGAARGRQGYPVLDLSDNEMAKLHVRHMVGGRAPGLKNELLYRFEFPERPGALLEFLEAIGDRWNISLFHYRNHGADYGRVLAGIQVPAADRAEFAQHLAELGYTHADETENPGVSAVPARERRASIDAQLLSVAHV